MVPLGVAPLCGPLCEEHRCSLGGHSNHHGAYPCSTYHGPDAQACLWMTRSTLSTASASPSAATGSSRRSALPDLTSRFNGANSCPKALCPPLLAPVSARRSGRHTRIAALTAIRAERIAAAGGAVRRRRDCRREVRHHARRGALARRLGVCALLVSPPVCLSARLLGGWVSF